MGRPLVLVLFGITGDLARRKLVPALAKIDSAKLLPAKMKIIGVTRQAIEFNQMLTHVDKKNHSGLQKKTELLQLNPADENEFVKLKSRIESIEKNQGKGQRIYYISVPPQISPALIENLGKSGLATHDDTKLLLEKPFGTDLVSAKELIEIIKLHFDESQIYRIDHFLAKEMAQNILVFRDRNALFRNAWNNQFIDEITILAAEKIDIEGRSIFYEQTGALRDIIQSHLMQLLALTLADIPVNANDRAVQSARLEALTALVPALPEESVRGQYEGYTQEVNNPKSKTETFAKITVYSDHPKWQGVPIHLISGKAMNRKNTAIRLHYKSVSGSEPNTLTLSIQPREGIELDIWAKQPGYERKAASTTMSFKYTQDSSSLPEAYEQVLLDALHSDKTLFATSEEILEAWRVLEPVQKAWEFGKPKLISYKRGARPEELAQ